MRVTKNAAWTAAVALSASVLTPLVATPAMAADEPAGPVVQEIRWNAETGGNLGYASSRTSCDVNGDGLTDAVSGDWWWDRTGGTNAGAAYVALGTSNPGSGPAFTDAGAARAASSGAGADAGIVRIDGAAVANQFAGMSITCLDDINGDGLDDIAIGSNRTQKVWVVLGATNFSAVDLSTLGARGFLVTSTDAVAENTATPVVSRNFGYWVSGLGDVNNDGFNDFAITDNLYDGESADNIGRVYVISGSGSVADVDIDTEAGAARVIATIDGFDTGGQILSAEDVGDVNGDGIDDFAAGSYSATPWGASPTAVGAAFVVFGSTQPLTVKASDLGSHGFTIRGPKRGGDRLGESVAKIGDVNGDGKADILVGGGNGSIAAVVFGSTSTETVYTNPAAGEAAGVYQCSGSASSNGDGACDDSAAAGERGYLLAGPASSNFGWASAGIDDLNGDGVPELLVGAYGADYNGLNNSGSVYVVYGKADGAGVYDASTITPEGTVDGFRLDGYTTNAKLGRSVGNAGDFDGNGTPDILGGAQGATANPLSYASVFLIEDVRTKTSLSAQGLTVGSIGRLTATVSPLSASLSSAVTAGTVAFADGDTVVEGCESVGVNAQGVATCDLPAAFDVTGAHPFRAVYGGSRGAFLPSQAELVGSVVPAPTNPGTGGGSGGGGSTSSTPTTTTPTTSTPTAPASTSAPVVVVVPAVVSATGVATATVPASAIADAVGTVAAGGTSGAVVLEVTAPAGTGSAVALTVPAAAFAQLTATPSVTSLAISSGAGSITLDRAALAAVVAAGPGADVTVSLTPVAPTAPGATAAFEVAISVGGTNVTTLGGGTVTVRLPYTGAQSAADVVVITRGATGGIELLPTTVGTGSVTFVTPHLSVFEIASLKAVKASVAPAKAGVAAAKAARSSVTLTLKKTRGATKVEIAYGKKGTAKSGWKTKTVSAAQLSVPVKGLKANTAYTFTVKAYSTLTGYEGAKSVTVKVYGAPASKTVTTKK